MTRQKIQPLDPEAARAVRSLPDSLQQTFLSLHAKMHEFGIHGVRNQPFSLTSGERGLLRIVDISLRPGRKTVKSVHTGVRVRRITTKEND